MLIVDPASTTSKKSDYTFIGVGSKATNDFTYVRDLVMKKLIFNDYCQKVVEMLENHDDITHIQIEKNTYQGADVVKIKELISKNDKLKYKNYEFINKMQKTNKDEKISTVINPINNGQIIINGDCEDSPEAIKQILDFQGQQYTLHDDAIDSISELQNALDEIEVVTNVEILDRKAFGL
jgi:predicted phage terminase large subunit-like protein